MQKLTGISKKIHDLVLCFTYLCVKFGQFWCFGCLVCLVRSKIIILGGTGEEKYVPSIEAYDLKRKSGMEVPFLHFWPGEYCRDNGAISEDSNGIKGYQIESDK